jgi:hypothetical protein
MSIRTPRTALAALLALALLPLAAQGMKGKSYSVQNKVAQMRSLPSFAGKLVMTLNYGDRIAVLEEKSGWVRAKSPDGKTEGWVNATALTAKKIVFSAGKDAAKSGVDSSEVALAGKGFNKEVEAKYKESGKVDYDWVDKAEAMGLPPESCLAFLEEGGLAAGGGE